MEKVNYKLLTSLIAVLFASQSIGFAQDQVPSRFKFGLRVAPSLNWIQVKEGGIDSRGVTPNMNYGIFTDFAIKGSSKYFVSTGINVISNGGRFYYRGVESENDLFYESENEVRMTTRYLEVPLGLKLRTDEIGYSVIGGYFGFGTGFRVNAFQHRTTTWSSPSGNHEDNYKRESIEDDLNPVRFSMIVGFELERKITKDTYFTFGANFNNGLSNIFKSDSYSTTDSGMLDWTSVQSNGEPQGNPLKATNKSVSIHLGIYF